jgi:uncharacterized protein with ParB-like and HNH nuclease domain
MQRKHRNFNMSLKTSATNRKIRSLITAIRDESLIPRPEFQRRLVWSNKDKSSFIQTILMGYPFPEIYIAAGIVDAETAESTEMLVDGQQRITTIYQYFRGDDDLKLSSDVLPYSRLTPDRQREFLEYDVVIRDLGAVSTKEIQEVFTRINSTKYSLNAMEIHNARYDGAFKQFADKLVSHAFFEKNNIFRASDVRRMNDRRFALTFLSTILSGYFNRDEGIEQFLKKYNDSFDLESDFHENLQKVFDVIDGCSFDSDSRAWKKADLFTLIVELYKTICIDNLTIDKHSFCKNINSFYNEVNSLKDRGIKADDKGDNDHTIYYFSTLQASNDRSSRIRRGEIINKIITNSLS